jgi:hypothetical protein
MAVRRVSLIVVGLLTAACGHKLVFLDATKVEVRPEPGHSIEGGEPLSINCGGSSTGQFGCSSPVKKPSPLRVRLLKLDRGEYRRMDRIWYDVSITNVSDQRVTLPWSPVPINRRDRPATGYRHALVELTFKRPNHDDWVADRFVLYGAPTVDGSLRVVHPGETVVVRMAGIFSGSGYQDSRNPMLYPTPDLQIAVAISMFAPSDEMFRLSEIAYSENTLPIRMIGPHK